MKIIGCSIASVFILLAILSCEKDDETANSLDDFCTIKPDGWNCKIILDNFSREDIPQGADNPIAIIKYFNAKREFTTYLVHRDNPSLILDIYPIEQKNELIGFINSQQLYSWCIPIYYGETKKYFIITSPCFINGGSFNDGANSSIEDLHNALKSIINVNNYND